MDEQQLLKRIVIDPKVMLGKPVVRGTRLTVQHVLGLLSRGTTEQVLAEYPGLQVEDVRACILFAQRSLDDISFMPAVAEVS